MKKLILFCFALLSFGIVNAQKPQHYYVKIVTEKGEGVIRMYNETPKHRDNFVKLVQEGFYQDLLFHRVIQNFMIQGGDPDSRDAKPGDRLGSGGLDYRVPAEFHPDLFHKKGVLAAARDNNPEKASSSTQFYLAQGRKFTKAGLDSMEINRLGGRKIPTAHRQVYETIGGVPHLDQNYTVFGEMVIGMDLIDKIAAVKTDQYDRPVEDQKMQMYLLNRRESINVERQLRGLKPKNDIFVRFFDLFKPKMVKIPE